MDPFTEKLLERTRARRQNLQKKMTERPNSANKQMVKRPREPLADTNIVASEPLVHPVLHESTRPSSSKRRCSGENVQPLDEENLNPLVSQPITSLQSDPSTGDKNSLGSVRPSSTLAKPQDSESVHVILSSDGPGTRNEEVTPASLKTYRNRENLIKDPLPSVTGMKSRLQKLAEQRKCWDGDGNSDVISETTLPYLLKRNTDVPTMSSETPLGRKGRLAHLAATIESWEDDKSCVNIARHIDKKKSGEAVSKFVVKNATVSSTSKVGSAGHPVAITAESFKSVPSSKPAQISVSKSAFQSVASSRLTIHESASSSKKEELSPSTSVLHNPQTNLNLSRDVCITDSPTKLEVHSKPDTDSLSVFNEKANGGGPGPGTKSFLNRFGDVCQKHTNQNSLGGGALQAKSTSETLSLTPNTSLVKERLGAAQISNTVTAYAIQRQKLERESELAQIRNSIKKGNNIWKNADDAGEVMKCSDIKFNKAVENDVPCEPQTEALTAKLPSELTDKPAECIFSDQGLMLPHPASTSSPLKMLPCIGEEPADNTQERQESVKEMEMNRDVSINSVIINELFGVLAQNEDSLNISSMSLLTPLDFVETRAVAVGTPERKITTSTPTSSFIVKNDTPDIKRSNIIQTSSSDNVEASDEHRLPYSIDSYRSTRVKETERPKVKQVIVRKENVSNRADEPNISNQFSIKQKMKILTNEINLQQTVIHQASQALNCCTDEEHGKGSQVEAEAERLLLVATEKREALKAELERLNGDPKEPKRQPDAPETSSMSPSKGSITLQELRLPLKADFVCSIANKPDSTKHSFFLMIRAKAENIVATPLASTHRGLSGDTLTFPSKFTMSDVSSDFEIDIEVYCLVQKHEMCSDKRKKPSKSKAITPKRFLAINKSVQTVVASPGGPNAVRTSNFGLVGSHKLSLASIGKNKFSLEKVPFLCPVEGHIYLKMQCEVGSKVEERGFLTMFEDVSGFGAWHRRWCVLSGYHISYWTYPDDEKHKNPIGCISLANCTSKQVEPANREFCARPNTFELITVRPQREDDKETLVSQCKNTICVTKNWLSADTKDERNLWIKKLNQILLDVRMWRPDALFRPL